MTERATIVSRERSCDVARERLRGVVDGGGDNMRGSATDIPPWFLGSFLGYFGACFSGRISLQRGGVPLSSLCSAYRSTKKLLSRDTIVALSVNLVLAWNGKSEIFNSKYLYTVLFRFCEEKSASKWNCQIAQNHGGHVMFGENHRSDRFGRIISSIPMSFLKDACNEIAI